MMTIGKNETQYRTLVADMYKQLIDAFNNAESESYTVEDYYWWAEFLVNRIFFIAKDCDGIKEFIDADSYEGEEETK